VTCRFILFDDALVGHAVNDRDRTVVSFLRRAVFASAYSSQNLASSWCERASEGLHCERVACRSVLLFYEPVVSSPRNLSGIQRAQILGEVDVYVNRSAPIR
jgi:hypothetical protein